jgi:hypothetical protein
MSDRTSSVSLFNKAVLSGFMASGLTIYGNRGFNAARGKKFLRTLRPRPLPDQSQRARRVAKTPWAVKSLKEPLVGSS